VKKEIPLTTQPAIGEALRAQFGLPDLVLHLTRLLSSGRPATVEEAAAAGGWARTSFAPSWPSTPASTAGTPGSD
jgi:hypothetical protein